MIVVLVLAFLLAAFKLISIIGPYRTAILSLIVSVLDWVRGLGMWSVPMIFACEALCFVTLVPITPLHIGTGFLYGASAGCLVAWTAYAIGWYLTPAPTRHRYPAPRFPPPLTLVLVLVSRSPVCRPFS